MTQARSRIKGVCGERELAGLIHDSLGVKARRNLSQSRQGGHDLITETGGGLLDRFAIEVKRYAKASPALIRKWWAQTERQAQEAGKVPVLAYREDRQDWRVVLPISVIGNGYSWPGIEWTAELSLDGFCAVVREASATTATPNEASP